MSARKLLGRTVLGSALMLLSATAGGSVARAEDAPANASASGEERSPWTYWLGGGAHFWEADEPFFANQLYDLRGSYDLDPNFTVEASLGGSPFFQAKHYPPGSKQEGTYNSYNSPGDSWLIRAHTDVMYHFNSDNHREWDPYMSLVGGMGYFGRQGDHEWNWAPYAGGGGGLSYWFSDDAAVRADYNIYAIGSRGEVNQDVLLMAFYRFGLGDDGANGSTDRGKDGTNGMGEHPNGPLKPIYFDFDKSNITSKSQSTLKENSDWMKAHPAQKVSVEGHCDERGTNEYNMALGARRAKAAYDYLRNLGIQKDQMSTISYGEEFPADPAHNEQAWAKNRRAESVLKK